MSYTLMNKDNSWDRLPKRLTQHSDRAKTIAEIEDMVKDTLKYVESEKYLDIDQKEVLTHMIYKAYWFGALDMMNAETNRRLKELVNQ